MVDSLDSRPKSVSLDWLLGLGLFGLALWLRATDLTHFVTADEHNWVYRSGLFLRALLQRDWPGTSVWLTPAVTTTWLGSTGLAGYYRLHESTIASPLVDWLASIPRNKIDLDVLLALRWSMALSTSLMVALIYGLARKLWARPVAVLGATFLLAEPHLLAVSRIIGHDALITSFAVASLLSFFQARRLLLSAAEGQAGAGYRWLILSGILAGLAVLSKAPALFLIPFVGCIAAVDIRGDQGRLRPWWRGLLLWGGALWLTFIAIWPAAWVDPLGQTWAVISNAFLSSAGLEDPDPQPYWAVPDLGPFYYLVNGAFKASPFLLIGLALAGFAGWRRRQRQNGLPAATTRAELLWLFVFAVLFGAFMTFGVKKSPRYILPAFPALAFVAAWGWLTSWQRLRKPASIALLGGLSLWLALNYAPYYFTYFNPLLGGAYTAPKLVRIGWGEGLDELGRWLDAQPDASAAHLGVRYTATIYPYYRGEISSPISDALDYVAFYIKQTQSGYPAPEILAYFDGQDPIHRVKLNGIEYARLYAGPAMKPVPANAGNLPVAYRPYTIYASIGQRLTVDLLWPAGVRANSLGDAVTLTLAPPDGSPTLEATASLREQTPGVIVSTHTFELPADFPRGAYTLLLNDAPLGSIEARRMEVPSSFTPLSFVVAGQLKLVGIERRVEGDSLAVDLAWQAWPGASNDYTVFIQLLDEAGQRVTGVDVLPGRGFTTLDRKEVMVTSYRVPLPDEMEPGSYTMLVGLYYFAGEELVNVGAVTLEEPLILE
ncbi:MAG: ArnT family glycosyltransferase [Anaerolineae bacterium]